MDDSLRNCDKLREGAGAPVIAGRHPKHFPSIAQIDLTAAAIFTFTAIYGRIRCDSVTFADAGYLRPQRNDRS